MHYLSCQVGIPPSQANISRILDLGIIILLNDVHLLNAFEPVEVIKSRFTN